MEKKLIVKVKGVMIFDLDGDNIDIASYLDEIRSVGAARV